MIRNARLIFPVVTLFEVNQIFRIIVIKILVIAYFLFFFLFLASALSLPLLSFFNRGSTNLILKFDPFGRAFPVNCLDTT